MNIRAKRSVGISYLVENNMRAGCGEVVRERNYEKWGEYNESEAHKIGRMRRHN